MKKDTRVSFCAYYGIEKNKLNEAGFFNISLISDIPLFIDPFNLFYSDNKEYEALHDEIIKYLSFLRDYSIRKGGQKLEKSDVDLYFRFPEVKQNWFGYSYVGNDGKGLGKKFANALNENFYKLFNTGTPGHIEKLALVADRVGKDCISDFTTNLIHAYLANITQKFAEANINKDELGIFTIKKAEFDYKYETWKPKTFKLPKFNGDYVLLTPKNLLTKEETWINKNDFIENFDEIPYSMSNEALRAQLIKYFNAKLNEYSEEKIDRKSGKIKLVRTAKTKRLATKATIIEFPQAIDVYIKKKEETGENAEKLSSSYVKETEDFKENQYTHFITNTEGFNKVPTTYDEAKVRANYFKECVETDLYIDFYDKDGVPASEDWVQRQFLYVWGGTISDVYREPKKARGRADYIVSRGAPDKCVVEFKLASSSSLEQNLENQLNEYKRLNKAQHGLWIIVVFNNDEYQKLQIIIEKLKLNREDIVIIDARKENKQAPSKMKRSLSN
ncbi:MAG: hypothetical protein NTZ87_01490 [Candidatus Nomurabacteria bacterium]|nr:hypothetical protein [Candidatus Nomurabacteria bacterium]